MKMMEFFPFSKMCALSLSLSLKLSIEHNFILHSHDGIFFNSRFRFYRNESGIILTAEFHHLICMKFEKDFF